VSAPTPRASRFPRQRLPEPVDEGWASDPAPWSPDRFLPMPGVTYLDGHSLGRAPRAYEEAMRRLSVDEWGRLGAEAWSFWGSRALEVGDRLGEVALGAAPGQVVLGDSTTVQLYKAIAAVGAAVPGRPTLVGVRGDFPTDRYLLQGLAARGHFAVRMAETEASIAGDLSDVLDESVAAVVVSHVQYASGALVPVEAICAAAHAVGAAVVLDCSHSLGAVPVELDRWGVDLAAGATYKHLSAGPGAPAFLYVRRALQERLSSPIWGWFGAEDVFAMGPDYLPAAGVRRFQAGTPPIVGLVGVDVGAAVAAEVGLPRLRARGLFLSRQATEAAADLERVGVGIAGPREVERRGSHLALAHPEAERLQAALAERRILTDFRRPDLLRIGLSPASTRPEEVETAFGALGELLGRG